MTGAGKSYPGLMLENRFCFRWMVVASIPVGEDDSVGDNLGEWITLRGRKVTLAILLGNNTLWGERYFAEMLMVTSLGIRRLCRERSFCGFWLRITQLYPGREITFE